MTCGVCIHLHVYNCVYIYIYIFLHLANWLIFKQNHDIRHSESSMPKEKEPGNSELASNPATNLPKNLPATRPEPSLTLPEPLGTFPQNQNSKPQHWSLRLTGPPHCIILLDSGVGAKSKPFCINSGTWSLPRQRLREGLGKGPSLNANHPLPQSNHGIPIYTNNQKCLGTSHGPPKSSIWVPILAWYVCNAAGSKDYKGRQQIALKTHRSWRRCWLQSCAAPCLGLGSWFWPIHNLHPTFMPSKLCILLQSIVHMLWTGVRTVLRTSARVQIVVQKCN